MLLGRSVNSTPAARAPHAVQQKLLNRHQRRILRAVAQTVVDRHSANYSRETAVPCVRSLRIAVDVDEGAAFKASAVEASAPDGTKTAADRDSW